MSRRRERTWRERHPFLFGLSQTFGIFGSGRQVDQGESTFWRVERAIDIAEKRVERER